MDYQRIYNDIIERGRLRDLDVSYYEVHHIIPKCMGGLDSDDNLVKLTYREHFISHWLLYNLNPCNSKLEFSFKTMAFGRGYKFKKNISYVPSSKLLEEKRIKLIQNQSTDEFKKKVQEGKLKKKIKQTARERQLEQYLTKCENVSIPPVVYYNTNYKPDIMVKQNNVLKPNKDIYYNINYID